MNQTTIEKKMLKFFGISNSEFVNFPDDLQDILMCYYLKRLRKKSFLKKNNDNKEILPFNRFEEKLNINELVKNEHLKKEKILILKKNKGGRNG